MKKRLFKTISIITIICISYVGGYFSAPQSINNSNNIDNNIIIDSVANMSSRFYGRKQAQKEILIPNEFVAAKIALTILEEKYGAGIYKESPFRVMCVDSIWIVETSLPILEENNLESRDNTQSLQMNVGGVGHVEINKNDGSIYCAYHTK